MRRWIAVVAVAALAVACAQGEEPGGATASPTDGPAAVDTVGIELVEWSVIADPAAVEADEITFEVSNGGEEEHEFAIARTDLDFAQLPTLEDGSVDEEQLDILGEVEGLEAGASGEVTVALEPGSYVLFCNLVHDEGEHEHEEPEVHYKLGMRAPFEAV